MKISQFYTKVNSDNLNETKSDIFYETYSNLTSFFNGCKILKYFSDFFNWHISISYFFAKLNTNK